MKTIVSMTKCKLINVSISYLLIIILGVVIGYVLIALSYCIPSAMTIEEAAESAAIFEAEGEYPLDNYSNHQLDNFTDSIMLQMASYSGSESVFERAACTYYSRIAGDSPTVSYVKLHTSDDHVANRVSYSQYWHGYQIFLRPLLTTFNLHEIRIINLVVQSILIAIIAVIISKKCNHCLVPFILMILFLAPSAIYRSLQFSSIYYVTLFAILLFLLFCEKLKTTLGGYAVCYYFLLIGIVSAYLDFLTFPSVSLMAPLCFLVAVIQDKPNTNARQLVRLLSLCAFSWFIGYAGMWAGKWLIAFGFQKTEFSRILVNAISFRVQTDAPGYETTRIGAALCNLKLLFVNPSLNAITGAFAFVLIAASIKAKCMLSKWLLNFTPFALPSLIPIAWICALCNHSFIHNWFTYRTLAPCILLLLTGMSVALQNSRTR